MEQAVHFAMCFYHGSCIIRDSIEYCLPNRKFMVQNFNVKKAVLEQLLTDNSYLKAFTNANGEKGEEIVKNVQSLYDLVYNSNYIRVDGEEITVDQTKNVRCITAVVGLKQTFTDICLMHLNHLKNEQKMDVDEKYFKLVEKEGEFFACVSTLCIAVNCFLDRFVAFNKSMKENKGQANVETNFISSEIESLVKNASFIRGKYEGKSKNFDRVVEAFKDGFDLMTGATKLLVDENHKLEDNFQPILQRIQAEVNALEPELKKLHTEVVNEMMEFEKNQLSANKN